MAKQPESRSRTKTRVPRRTRAPHQRVPQPIPEGLSEAIENERGHLMKAESLLACLVISLEHGEDGIKGPYYPDIAEMARALVRRAINGLDTLELQRRL